MVAVKVWLGGEGNNDLGGDGEVGAIEALLRRVERDGWQVCGKTPWWTLRKYRAGGALRMPTGHGDAKNTAKLALTAWEGGADVLAFTRDLDADTERPQAVDDGLAASAGIDIRIIGGIARPAIEGWLAALLGITGTDQMSRDRVARELAAKGTTLKETEEYVAIITEAHAGLVLRDRHRTGCGSLRDWLQRAADVLGNAIRG